MNMMVILEKRSNVENLQKTDDYLAKESHEKKVSLKGQDDL